MAKKPTGSSLRRDLDSQLSNGRSRLRPPMPLMQFASASPAESGKWFAIQFDLHARPET